MQVTFAKLLIHPVAPTFFVFSTPFSACTSPKKVPTSSLGPDSHPPQLVKICQKNCWSLKSDDRLEELERELDASEEIWAAVLLNETWRENEKELWTTK